MLRQLDGGDVRHDGEVLDDRWVVKVSDMAAVLRALQVGEPWSWDAYMEMLLQKEMLAEEDSEDEDESANCLPQKNVF